MSESGPWQPAIDDAERAAGAGDYALAEQQLRQAAALQEAALGPLHPDLANTLNNLGVVCEITNRPEDAERAYRRAYKIAVSSLPSGHPFVATSLQNLTDFCNARQLPVNLPEPDEQATVVNTPHRPPPGLGELQVPPEPPAIVTASDVTGPGKPEPGSSSKPATSSAQPSAARESPPSPLPSPPTRGPSSRSVWWIAALAVLAVAVWALWPKPPREELPGQGGGPPAAPSSVPAGVAPGPPPAPAATQPAAPRSDSGELPPAPASSPPAAAPGSAPARTGGAPGPTVVDARLCRDLVRQGEWVCKPPESPAGLGPMYFFVRLKSAADTVVHVRWYRDDQLRQSGDLSIRANQSAGYRSYSRHTIDRAGGSWRVEVKSPDGRVLAEERFTVRSPAA